MAAAWETKSSLHQTLSLALPSGAACLFNSVLRFRSGRYRARMIFLVIEVLTFLRANCTQRKRLPSIGYRHLKYRNTTSEKSILHTFPAHRSVDAFAGPQELTR